MGASAASPALAWITLAEGEAGKLEAETRLMFWAVHSGRQSADDEEPVRDFFIRRGRLALRARVSRSLDLHLQVGQDNIGSKLLADDGSVRIKDLSLNYRSREALQVHLGQFKVPFLRSNLEAGHNQLLVDRPALPGLRPAREGTRDLGAMLWGNRGGFQYRAALLDGSDQEDDNSGSSFRGSGRVSFNWFTPESGLAYTGTSLGEKRVLQVAAQIDAQNDRLDPRDDEDFADLERDYRAWAAEAFYDQPFGGGWALTLEGAWLDRRDDYEDPLPGGPVVPDERRISGFYAQAGFLLPGRVGTGRLQLVARHEDLETERGRMVTRARNRSIGIAFFAKGHERKIQFDYTDRREEPVERDNDEFRLSVVAVF